MTEKLFRHFNVDRFSPFSGRKLLRALKGDLREIIETGEDPVTGTAEMFKMFNNQKLVNFKRASQMDFNTPTWVRVKATFKHTIFKTKKDYVYTETHIVYAQAPQNAMEEYQRIVTASNLVATQSAYEIYELMDILDWSEIPQSKVGTPGMIKQRRMMQASALKYDAIPSDFSYDKNENTCVYDAILGRYSPLIKRLTKQRLMTIFDEQDEHNGVTPEQVLKFCEKYNITMYAFDLCKTMVLKHISTTNNYPPLCFYIANDHMYIITDKKFIASVSHARITEAKHHTDLVEEKPYAKQGNVSICADTDNLYDKFIEIYKKHRTIADVKMVNGKMTQMQLGDKIVEANPNYRQRVDPSRVEQVCASFNIPFENQSVGTLSRQLFDAFMDGKRVKFSDDTRTNIYKKQNNKCATCEKNAPTQIDHILPLANGGNNNMDNLQGLCKQCHQDKSKNESEEGYFNVDELASSYGTHTDGIVNGPGFRRWAFTEWEEQDERPTLCNEPKCIDINKCRKNILRNSKYDYCVYSVLDQPTKFKHVQPGFFYVETDAYFPMRGTRWYSQPMVEYALELNIIELEDIKYQYVPSFTVPHDYFVKYIDSVYEIEDKPLAKLIINSFIGTFNKNEFSFTKAVFSEQFADMSYFYMKNNTNDVHISEDAGLYMLQSTKTIKTDSNKRPIYAQVLDLEAIELHKLERLVNEHGYVVSGLCTDAVYYYGDKFDIDTDKYKYEDKKVETRVNRMKGVMGNYTYKLPKFGYKIMDELDDYDELAKNIVDLQAGCTIQGKAGTGKTTLIKKIVNQLGTKKYKILAPTNMACRNYEKASTLHKFASSYFYDPKKMEQIAKNYEYIIVDEISMVREIFYKMLLFCKRLGCKIILVGDFGQFEPVKDRAKFRYGRTAVFSELSDGNKLHLTKCRRASRDGQRLFKMCEDITNADVGFLRNDKTSHINICYTNYKRIQLNGRCMDEFTCGKRTVFLKKRKNDDNSQDVRLCKGMPVIARVNNKKNEIYNNEHFTIKKASQTTITLENEEKTIELPSALFQAMFYVRFAVTAHRSQGMTIDEPYCIHEWDKLARDDGRGQYVAITRCTKLGNVTIV